LASSIKAQYLIINFMAKAFSISSIPLAQITISTREAGRMGLEMDLAIISMLMALSTRETGRTI
jgi:hypothetical protein